MELNDLGGFYFDGDSIPSFASHRLSSKSRTVVLCLRYFGFITKHPADHRFACHVFVSEESTKPLAESVG